MRLLAITFACLTYFCHARRVNLESNQKSQRLGDTARSRDEAPQPTTGPASSLRSMNNLERDMFHNAAFPVDCQVPDSMMVINTVALFRHLPSDKKTLEVLKQGFAKFARFHAVPVQGGMWSELMLDGIDFDRHLHREADVAGDDDMNRVLERIANEPLDGTGPLWSVHVIPNRKGLSALVLRVHHSVGDGLALSQLMREVTTLEGGGQMEQVDALKKFRQMKRGSGRFKAAQQAGKMIFMCLDAIPAFFRNVIASTGRLEPHTKFNAPLEDREALEWSGQRRLVRVPPISLDYVRACKKVARVSVNDVLMGVCAGAMRRYCEEHGDLLFPAGSGKVPGARFHALVPVMLPPSLPPGTREDDMLTNNFCFCSVPFPVGQASPEERVRATSKHMNKIKNSMTPFVSNWIVNSLNPLLPKFQTQALAKNLFQRHSLIFSNVPGPTERLYFAGEPIEGIFSFFYNLIPQAILLSYCGQIRMALVVDPSVVSDADSFARHYIEELRELGQQLGVSGDPQAS